MAVEIGSMLSLNTGTNVYSILRENDKVLYIFFETGRSEDLFADKQFGEFGEASILTVIVEEEGKDEVFSQIYEAANLNEEDGGIIFINKKIEKHSLFRHP